MCPDDQRQEYRLEIQLTVFLELGSEYSQEPTIVVSRSLDISANGLRVITDRELPIGSILHSCVQNQDASRRFMLVTEIKWLQPWQNTDEFLVGLSLLESENSDILEWKRYIAGECVKTLTNFTK